MQFDGDGFLLTKKNYSYHGYVSFARSSNQNIFKPPVPLNFIRFRLAMDKQFAGRWSDRPGQVSLVN